MYRNNRDGPSPTSPNKPAVSAGATAWASPPEITMATAFQICTSHKRPQHPVPQQGDGTFTDVTEKAGVAARLASSAVWFDYDNDGKLDLFVCRFVDFDNRKINSAEMSARANATTAFRASTNPRKAGSSTTMAMARLLRHQDSGIGKCSRKAWGVVATDVKNDALDGSLRRQRHRRKFSFS